MNLPISPHFSIDIMPPAKEIREKLGKAFLREEEASLFLWAWRELLGWEQDFEWIFSPVVGQTWPGDVWGIDERGALLVVETKKASRAEDPLRDFVGYMDKKPVRGTNPARSTELILARWEDSLKMEMRFIERFRDHLSHESEWGGPHAGVVPYSRKRFAVQKWPEVYLERIVPRITSADYKDRVRRWLDKRGQGEGKVHFCGLFSATGNELPRLSAEGRRNSEQLRLEIGGDQVHWRAIGAYPQPNGILRLVGWMPQLKL
jgi:hypothetical protein